MGDLEPLLPAKRLTPAPMNMSAVLRALLLPLCWLPVLGWGARAETGPLTGPVGGAAGAQEDQTADPLGPVTALGALQLELRPPASVEWTDRGPRFADERLFWTGKLGEQRWHLALYQPPAGAEEPDGALRDTMHAYSRDADSPYVFGAIEYREGAYGSAPYLAHVRAKKQVATDAVGELYLLAGVTPAGAYICELAIEPPASGAVLSAVEAFLAKGLTYSGELRDPEWSEAEVEARIARDFPEKVREARQQVIRTEHYIVLGNSSGAKAFGKEIEKHYDSIQERYPFPEVKGRKLMPVYLFRNRADYIDFYVHITGGQVTAAQAAQSGGHAWRDYYATHYESPKDSTHIHELTHQIFSNRLLLSGGGSWYQEGAAVFSETGYTPDEKQGVENFGRAAAKKGEFQPFKEFMATESLLYSNVSPESEKSGENRAGDAYTQAGTIFWFVFNAKETKAKAQEWLHAIGALPRGDLKAIEAALQRVYGVDIAGFEALYIKYWKSAK
jgi:hypothetical protein